MKGFDYVPSAEVVNKFYMQVLDDLPQKTNDPLALLTQDKAEQNKLAIGRTIFGDWNRKLT